MTMHPNMPRLLLYFAGFLLAGLLSPPAQAMDPFGTDQDTVNGPFQFTQDSSACDRNKINQPLTLTDVVDLALCNNPQTRELWASARAQAASVGENMANYLPTLTAQASSTRGHTTVGSYTSSSRDQNVSLSASYLLYDFGGRPARLRNARELLIAANATRDSTLQANFLAAVQAYYSLLSARASVDSLTTAETSAREALSAAAARFEAGVATPNDKLQAQTALSQATLNLINARGNERIAEGKLANIMGFDADQPFKLAPLPESEPDPAVEQDIGKLITQARQNRPDLAAANAQIKAAQAQLDNMRAAGRPTLTLNADASHSSATGTQISTGSPATSGSSFSIMLNVPLFTGFQNSYQQNLAEQQLQGKIAARDLLANQVAFDVWSAYQTMLMDSQALRTAETLLTSATANEEMTLGRYKAGVGGLSIVDVLTAQSALASARQQRVAALYNFLVSRISLAQAIGVLDLTQLDQRLSHAGQNNKE